STPPAGDCALLSPAPWSIWIDVRKASGCHLVRTYATARCAIAGTSLAGHWTCPGSTWLAAALCVGADESDSEWWHAQMPAAITIVRAKRAIALTRDDRGRCRNE